MSEPPFRHGQTWPVFLGYLIFVVYGSLVPFEYRPLPLDAALAQFAQIPFLNLGVGSRADWVANLVLYVPLAFLGAAWLTQGTPRVPRPLVLTLVGLFCVGLAVAVEFTQLFFAPRTVSLNDLLAETLGTLVGLLLFQVGHGRLTRLAADFAAGGHASVVAALSLFGLGYGLLSLFPYDVLISWEELRAKLAAGNQGWLLAGTCDAWLRCAARQAGELVAIMPLGVLLTLAMPSLSRRRILVLGLALGLALEAAQLLLASGISQGLSVLGRGLGLLAGALLGQSLRQWGPRPLARWISLALPLLALPYVALLAALGGWLGDPWVSFREALARLAEVRLMPLYYHYYSTEPAAMASLLAQAGLYAPMGLAAWALTTRRVRVSPWSAWGVGLSAAALALPIELGKLLAPPRHPDLTNLLIAAASAALIYRLGHWLNQVLKGGVTVPADRVEPAPAPPPAVFTPPAPPWPAPGPLGLVLALGAGLLAMAGVALYPLGQAWLIIALLGYGVLIWRRPWTLFLALPALLPSLDLSPFTGRPLLDEFDLLVLVSLAVGYARLHGLPPRPWPSRWLPLALTLLWLSWVVASARGLWPLLEMPEPFADSSHSPLETWRVGKGLLWALLFVPLLRRIPRAERERVGARIRAGLVTGLALVTLVVLWERHVFVGLMDFDDLFRVTGTFAGMHTGGAYIEAFLAFAFPALLVGILVTGNGPLKLLGAVLAGLASYAMLVTFSRGGYAGLVAGLLVVMLGLARQRGGSNARRWLAFAGVTGIVLAAALPILSGGFAQARLARAGADLAIRQAHWHQALGLMDQGPLSALVGMGFGQYPLLYLVRAPVARLPGTYGLIREGDTHFLRLGAGEPLFLDQILPIQPGGRHTLSARVRQFDGASSLRVALCEKALLYSFQCAWQSLPAPTSPGAWETVSLAVETGPLGKGGPWPHRPVKLSLFNPGPGGLLDVTAVSLKTSDGREVVTNGGFQNGLAGWLFVTDHKPAWHMDQQFLEVYFAQGLLGLTALLALLIGVARLLGPALWAGDAGATLFAGALAGFLTVGLLGSTLDTARLSLLFYWGAWSAALLTSRRRNLSKDDGSS